MTETSKILAKTPFEVDKLLRRRVTEAVIAQSRLKHAGLNQLLRDALGGDNISNGALFAEPVLEAATGYLTSGKRPSELGSLLHPDLIRALTECDDEIFRFLYPAYQHQVEAWEKLRTEQWNSVLVSSGTGSGKTECFLVPMLNDLAKESEAAGKLTGVRAIMLYPLNALIASQEKRLSQWTQRFDGRIRFALYNGLMNEKRERDADREEAKFPNQILYRNTLRRDPPPILVTNNTMLEYLTIRQEDRNIVEASQGKLRWIVIDEAHSYVGSAAAELALLLRRVMQTFGVEAGQVRIVATSATIGSNSEEDQRTLQSFLADIAGVPSEQAHVIIGTAQPVELGEVVSKATKNDGCLVERSELTKHPAVHSTAALFGKGPLALSSLAEPAEQLDMSPAQLSEMLAGVGDENSKLIAQRVHGFVRAIPGLWTCLDPTCTVARPTDWPFGSILHAAIPQCPHCEAPVFEIVSCKECSEIYLLGRDDGERLVPRDAAPDFDEYVSASARDGETSFFEDAGTEADDELAKLAAIGDPRVIALRQLAKTRAVHVNPSDGSIFDTTDGMVTWCGAPSLDGECLHCSAKPNANGMGPLWPFRFGAPFLMQNVVPTLLEGVTPVEDQNVKLAFDGRRLISFTDSRQGTARLAANIETMGERGYVRSCIYHMVQKAGASEIPTNEDLQEIEELKLASCNATGAVKAALEAQIRLLSQKLIGGDGIAWNDLVATLAEEPMVDQIMQVWGDDRERRYHDDRRALARFLVMRELARRPRLANSIETLGFAQLVFPDIERLTDTNVPDDFRRHAKTIRDWQDFLYFMTDWLRGSFAVRIEPEDAHWMPGSSFPRQVIAPGETKGRLTDLPWPSVNLKGVQSNAILALAAGLNLDLSEAEDRDIIQRTMASAWHALRPLLEGTGSTYALDLSKALIAKTTNAWLCPCTGKVINYTLFGYSQNAFRSRHPQAKERPQELFFPQLPVTFPQDKHDANAAIENFLCENSQVAELRTLGVWSALHDSGVRYAPYLRAEEHSAQQPPHRLRAFEEQFAEGKINLLACSTTMEMGVDIGSIEAVLNTNVPPSIANYKQRVGRAGRRNQSFSYSMTLARDTALDREAFSDPTSYLARKVRAPKVSLDSTRIVQRHCNAMLLGIWLRMADGQLTKLKSGPFFGCREDFKESEASSPADDFIAWLNLPSSRKNCVATLTKLVDRTGLQGNTEIMDECANMFSGAQNDFKTNWGRLADEAASASGPGKTSAEIRARRMLREPLLKELANRSLLPGSGFPSAVVPFVTDCDARRPRAASSDREEQQTSRNQRYDYPSRNADIAIREYAPGADVVIDGLVWKSAGVTLNWHRHAAEEEYAQIQSLRESWLCNGCGEVGTYMSRVQACRSCGSTDLTRDRFLQPAGFRVERTAKPHADTDNASYIEPMPPYISANGAAWQPLLDAELGRIRSTADGLVLHLSKGRKKEGYRLCLDCGRMCEEHEGQLQDHEPLGYTKDKSGLCSGNDKAFAITETIALGHEVLTDVVELQFENLVHEGATWAIASALREALARFLAIEAREMGIGVFSRTGRLAAKTHSIYLFDQATGGAGYAPRLLDALDSILSEAASILDCPLHCVRGCSACVLTADLYAQQNKIDRQLALDWINLLNNRIVRPDPEDLAVPGAKLSPRIGDAIAAMVRANDEIIIIAKEAFTIESLQLPPMSDLFTLAHKRSAHVTLVLDEELFNGMDAVDRVAIRNSALRQRINLATLDSSHLATYPWLLATVTQEGRTSGFFSRDQNAGAIGADWGMGTIHPVVMGAIPQIGLAKSIHPDQLELKSSMTDSVLLIDNFPVTMIPNFGLRLIQDYLKPKLSEIGRWLPGELQSVRYSDRYLRSPMSVMLALDTISAFGKALGNGGPIDCEIITRPLNKGDWRRTPSRLWDDWNSEHDRATVAQNCALSKSVALDWNIAEPPHRREMTLSFVNGQTCQIFFDQGFGYWTAERHTKFDFTMNAVSQAARLTQESVAVIGNGQTYLALKCS